jgi:RNA polymerase sigma-70 factor (ECF subfamily)
MHPPPPPPSETELRRVYIDALERAVRHAAVHVSRDEAREIGHHVASAIARRYAQEREGNVAPSPISDVDAFVHRAVLNRLRELWRAKRRRNVVEQTYHSERSAVAPAWTQPGANLESRELHRVIDAAIAAMPEVRREVFLRIRRDQRSYKEVAAELGIGVGTVHTHLSRANAALRDAVAEFRAVGNANTIGQRTIGTGT